ncbi:aminotransferase class V-fold PLP-dependent enzyme [Reinekea thalattae]|uniref:Aminotransferase class V-fold PLP-dependent enzyme n=1 Tax=Reinekea thalattae TaxID=2593301 RepID=A0A5C8Z9S7_9GAMM|nr:aminotransferase class V-fold PLP-dependent enzyme [Reinekea thalattae]TXR53626.1 aminotransferase class V-fold PLP-dependent enzyme [Reinekea thalattae]
MTQPSVTKQPEYDFWSEIRRNTIHDQQSPHRIYADWTAGGKLYRPIEQRLVDVAGSVMANTHTRSSYSGRQMTALVEQAKQKIKQHVNALEQDILLNVGFGMTAALAKLIRILGLSCHESHKNLIAAHMENRPVVYMTHREHHSNQVMWQQSLAQVRIIPMLEGDDIDLQWLRDDLQKLPANTRIIASVTAASNVTGIKTPYREIAKIMHQAGGVCFVDFAASAPYVEIDMHPNEEERLDAIFFSPHKFLGGPGSSGVLVFNESLYANKVPDVPGGGTVVWTDPWGGQRYINDIEERESGGTPGILQVLKTALAIQLKEEMGVSAMAQREAVLNKRLFDRVDQIANVRVLSGHQRERLSVFSLVFSNLDYRKAVVALSERYAIETRGGYTCAGTYSHYLLDIDKARSNSISQYLSQDSSYLKPGWVRVSLHPMMTNEQVDSIADAIAAVAELPSDTQITPEQSHLDFWQSLS